MFPIYLSMVAQHVFSCSSWPGLTFFMSTCRAALTLRGMKASPIMDVLLACSPADLMYETVYVSAKGMLLCMPLICLLSSYGSGVTACRSVQRHITSTDSQDNIKSSMSPSPAPHAAARAGRQA